MSHSVQLSALQVIFQRYLLGERMRLLIRFMEELTYSCCSPFYRRKLQHEYEFGKSMVGGGCYLIKTCIKICLLPVFYSPYTPFVGRLKTRNYLILFCFSSY